MALSGLWLLYDLFFSVFGNTGLTHLDEAEGRTSSTGTPSASAEASTPTVRSRYYRGFHANLSEVGLERKPDERMLG